MKAEIMSVGTELLLGNILNSNSQFLSQELALLGIDVYFQTTVGDNKQRIIETTLAALERADILIFTGGLGPTNDDITKEAVCEVLNLDLQLDERILSAIKKRFVDNNICMANNNLKQALVPENSTILKNDYGTAPGIYLNCKDKILIMLPGPPNEMIPMFDNYVKPLLKSLTSFTIKSKVIKTIDICESSLEEMISDLILGHKNPSIATYAKDGQVDIRITAKADSEILADKMLLDIQTKIEDKIIQYIYGYDDDKLEKVVLELANKLNTKIGFCESCTGGLITSMFTKLPGASNVLDRSIVTYSNTSKIEEVHVDAHILEMYGAVSEETAVQMANGLLERTDIDLAVSVTGIAGPTGGTIEKPVGLVYIGIASKKRCLVFKRFFKGDRETIQIRTANTVYNLIRKYLLNLL
jgi:competence/damage-inducible protein CinA-like protein